MLQKGIRFAKRCFSNKFLDGKLAVITGAASGIGYATSQVFLENGADVCMFDIREDVLEKKVDVTNRDNVESTVDEIENNIGGIDILVNNAGIIADTWMWKMTEEDWDKVIDVNLKGLFLCGTACARKMIEREAGVILITSSVVGLYGNLGQTNYAAAKFGAIGLTKTWAKELGRNGIRVNAVAPGYTMTEILEPVPEKVLEKLKAQSPLNRLGEPEDIANAFAFLASDKADYITGHVLSVDGGLVL